MANRGAPLQGGSWRGDPQQRVRPRSRPVMVVDRDDETVRAKDDTLGVQDGANAPLQGDVDTRLEDVAFAGGRHVESDDALHAEVPLDGDRLQTFPGAAAIESRNLAGRRRESQTHDALVLGRLTIDDHGISRAVIFHDGLERDEHVTAGETQSLDAAIALRFDGELLVRDRDSLDDLRAVF